MNVDYAQFQGNYLNEKSTGFRDSLCSVCSLLGALDFGTRANTRFNLKFLHVNFLEKKKHPEKLHFTFFFFFYQERYSFFLILE